MNASLSEYYINELDEWKSTINFHLEDIEELETWLRTILHANTVVKLTAMVEHFLNQLVLCKINFKGIKSNIEAFENNLFKGNAPSGNEIITEEIKTSQKQLRNSMYKTEKEYIDIKYHCDEFLADTVAIQNLKKKGGGH